MSVQHQTPVNRADYLQEELLFSLLKLCHSIQKADNSGPILRVFKWDIKKKSSLFHNEEMRHQKSVSSGQKVAVSSKRKLTQRSRNESAAGKFSDVSVPVIPQVQLNPCPSWDFPAQVRILLVLPMVVQIWFLHSNPRSSYFQQCHPCKQPSPLTSGRKCLWSWDLR